MMMPLQFASTAVMLEDVSLDGRSVIVMLLLFAVIPGSYTSGQNSGLVMVLPLLFAYIAVVMTCMFLIGTACGCCTSDKGFVQMFVLST
jgi:hypothetical protein